MASRFLEILLAYVAACVAGAAVLVFATAPLALVYWPALPSALLLVAYGAGLIALSAALPAVLVVLYAERQCKRSRAFYAVAGGLVGLFASVVLFAMSVMNPARKMSSMTVESTAWFAPFFALMMVAGTCAGLVYWAIAGRRAGLPGR